MAAIEGRHTVASTSSITLLYLIKQVELAVRSRLDDVVGTEGLTSLQYTALTVLERHPGSTSAELARNSFVRAQTMAQMTTFLEDRGFVRREKDPLNKKQLLLFLTSSGSGVLAALKDQVASIESRMVGDFGEGESEQLRRLLHLSRESLAGTPVH